MELIIFIGLQASGKSSFYRARFSHSHLRLNLDMLRTRHREKLLFEACLSSKTSCVIDNTNPHPEDRARYIRPALEAGFRVRGFYFRSSLMECIKRNATRPERERVPERGLRGTSAQLKLPRLEEGFHQLSYVWIEAGELQVAPWDSSL